jgi:predicted  nucleic acid-binding Zn-ribbon protein
VPVDRDLADARERLAALEVEVRTLTQLAEGVKFAAENAVITSERLTDLRHQLEQTVKGLTKEVDRAVAGCEALSAKLDSSQTAKINGRYLLYAALVTGALAILAKLLGIA